MKFLIDKVIKFSLSKDGQNTAFEYVMMGKSVVVNACAGAGKSFTAFAIAVNYAGKVFSIPFSRTLADEEQRKYADHPHVGSLNFHRWGMKLLASLRVWVDFDKCLRIAEKINGEFARSTAELATKFKTEGVDVYANALTHDEIAVKYSFKLELVPDAIEVLRLSDLDTKSIDFEDMLRMPILLGKQQLLDGLIILDEVQDYTPLAFAFLTECLTTADSQVLMIGDPSRQNLMAFAGANPTIFDEMANFYSCENVDFTVNRRCAKAIVAAAPHSGNMVALPDAPEGTVESLPVAQVLNDVCDGLYEYDAILSEANAPLVKLGIELLTKGVPVQMRTDKLEKSIYRVAFQYLDQRTTEIGDIANKLNADLDGLASEGGDVGDARDIAKCIEMLETYCMANCIIKTTFAPNGRKANGKVKFKPMHPIFQALNKMVGDKGITLLTGHTAKGLEWNTVFHLEGSMKAPEQEWQEQQQACLAHVIATRAITRFVTLTE
jgi:hypothetical protein